MKLLLLTILLFSHLLQASNHTLTNDDSDSLSLPTNWVKTVIGELFYDTDFVVTDASNSDMLLLSHYPSGFILDRNSLSNKETIKSQVEIFRQIDDNDALLKADESIEHIVYSDNGDSYGTFLTSKFVNSDNYNYSWFGTVNQKTILLKIITKSAAKKYNEKQVLDLINNLELVDSVANIDDITPLSSAYGFQIYHSPILTVDEKLAANQDYAYMHTGFDEDDRFSKYFIASQCSGLSIPEDILTGVVMDSFGYENTVYQGYNHYRNKRYYMTSGKYSNSNGQYHTLTAVINAGSCQHLLAYITETNESPVDRFLLLMDQFKIKENFSFDHKKDLPKAHLQHYKNLLSKLAYSFYNLDIYKHSAHLYQQVFDLDHSLDTFENLLQSHYSVGDYQRCLQLVQEHEHRFETGKLDSWKAWIYLKQNKKRISQTFFKAIFDNGFSNDEDLFKYIDLLHENKDYQQAVKVAQRYLNSVANKTSLKLSIAKSLTKYDKTKAKKQIISLLNEPQIINKHQFTLFDYLADIGEYQVIVDYAKARIKNGYESAVLHNYLGDAQNALGNIDQAYASMKKAHEMAPGNKTIKSYYKSLQNKVGKADLATTETTISMVALPEEIQNNIKTLKPKHNTESYEYLYEIKAYYHEPKQRNKKTTYGKIKIYNDSGVAKNKTFRFSYNQQYENIYINYLRVYDENSKLIAELNRSNSYITTDNDGITADDDKILNIPVPAMATGVTVEYATTVESKTKNDSQNLIDILFVAAVETQYKAVVFHGDFNAIKVVTSKGLPVHKISNKLIFWDYHDLENFRKTPYLPDYQDIFPWIKIATVKDSWVQLGDDYLTDINKKINSQLPASQIIPLYRETDDDISKAQAIAAFVQKNISYQAIEFGWRAFVPNKSTQTMENKYGDCKDHAVLLYDMLNAAGIKAQLALVNSGDDIHLGLPSFGQFNHMIVYLPEINNGVFVDVTDKDSSLNFLNPPFGLQGNHSLVLAEHSSKLIQIPIAFSNHNVIEVYRTVKSTDDKFIYQEQANISGYYASIFRDYLKGIELDELESSILSWVNDYYSDLMIDEFKYHNLYDNSKPLKLEFSFSQEIELANTKLPIFLERYAMTFTQSPHRQWDFEYEHPFRIVSTTIIEKNSKLKFKKKDFSIDSQLMKWNIHSGKKTIQFDSEIFANKLPPSEYHKLVKQSKRSYKLIESLLD